MLNKSSGVFLPSNIIEVWEYECLWYVKTTSNDVFSVLTGKSLALLHRKIFPHALLIISQLYNERDLEGILKVSARNIKHGPNVIELSIRSTFKNIKQHIHVAAKKKKSSLLFLLILAKLQKLSIKFHLFRNDSTNNNWN